MSELALIPKLDKDASIFPAWVPTTDIHGNTVRPHIRCNCGRYMSCNAHHIHADGTITASWLDPKCGWHVFLKLAGYDQGEFLPEAANA